MAQPTAIALPFRPDTPAWEEARRDGIGSSDAPIIAGERGSVTALWAIKTRQLDAEPIDEELAAMYEAGHELEPAIARIYTRRTGRRLKQPGAMLARRDTPWARATLDRVSAEKGERRIVELKTNPWARWGAGEPVPGAVQAQVQHQLWVTGYDVADVAVLHRGYDLRIHEVGRDDRFIDDLIYLEREFWRYVQARKRPPVDGSDETRRALARLFPRDTGEILPGTPAIDALAYDLRRATRDRKRAEEREGSIKNALRAIIGDAAGVQGDGYRLHLKRAKDTTEVDHALVAAAYRRQLEELGAQAEELDTLAGLYTITKPGSRALRPWYAGELEEEDTAA